MGRIPKAVSRYEIDEAGLNPPELETIKILAEHYPQVVPYHRGSHLSTGEWSSAMNHANVVHDIRTKLGHSAIETVRFRGYRLGQSLLGLLSGECHVSPGSSTDHLRMSEIQESTSERGHTRSHLRRTWQSPIPHRNRQDSIHSQLLQSCLHAEGL